MLMMIPLQSWGADAELRRLVSATALIGPKDIVKYTSVKYTSVDACFTEWGAA